MSTQVAKPNTTDPAKKWETYWKTQGQPWRTEPEIDTKRQEELAQRRTIVPDIQRAYQCFPDEKVRRTI